MINNVLSRCPFNLGVTYNDNNNKHTRVIITIMHNVT